jgi:hypothetical protein
MLCPVSIFIVSARCYLYSSTIDGLWLYKYSCGLRLSTPLIQRIQVLRYTSEISFIYKMFPLSPTLPSHSCIYSYTTMHTMQNSLTTCIVHMHVKECMELCVNHALRSSPSQHYSINFISYIYTVSGKKWPPKTYCNKSCKPIPIQFKFYTHEDISISNKRQCVSSQYNAVRRNMRYEIARGVKI